MEISQAGEVAAGVAVAIGAIKLAEIAICTVRDSLGGKVACDEKRSFDFEDRHKLSELHEWHKPEASGFSWKGIDKIEETLQEILKGITRLNDNIANLNQNIRGFIDHEYNIRK